MRGRCEDGPHQPSTTGHADIESDSANSSAIRTVSRCIRAKYTSQLLPRADHKPHPRSSIASQSAHTRRLRLCQSWYESDHGRTENGREADFPHSSLQWHFPATFRFSGAPARRLIHAPAERSAFSQTRSCIRLGNFHPSVYIAQGAHENPFP
jgi:hypothetical protein